MTKKFLLYIPENDLIRWKGLAKAEGLSLAAWMRKRCNDGAKPRRAVRETAKEMAYKNAAGQHDDAPSSAEMPIAPTKKARTCEHGTAQGYRCWQCGGLAKMVKNA